MADTPKAPVEAADRERRADAILRAIEPRVAFAVEQSRRAVEAFLGELDAEPTATPDRRDAGPSGHQLALHASRWRHLVPVDPGERAALVRVLSRRFEFGPEDGPAIRAVLGLDEPELVTAYRVAYSAPIELAFGSGPAAPPTRRIEDDLEWLSLSAGQTLFRQGDPGDSMYLVVSGRFRVVLERGDAPPETINEVGRGQIVGEMAILTGDARSATLIARRDSEVVRLSRHSFDRIVDANPRAMRRVAMGLVSALRDRGRHAATTVPITIAVIPGGAGLPLGEFCQKLAVALGRAGATLHLDGARVNAMAGPAATDVDRAHLVAWLSEQEGAHTHVVYQADPHVSEWSRRCIRQADRVLVVAAAGEDRAHHPLELELERLKSDGVAPRTELVLVHARRDRFPIGTAAWLGTRAVAAHHHVCLDSADDLARLVRRLTGRAIGLALAGGGARGFVHLGVLRALREVGIPIDVVGGTSMGAAIAAQCALEWDEDTLARVNQRTFVDRPSAPNYTVPVVALSTAESYSRGLRDMFGETAIEDLWIPFFAVASSLTTGDVVVIDRGPVWLAVRASTSLPGIMPPVPWNGQLLVDGGILNNLPADIVRARCEGGKVIAVDCIPRQGPTAEHDYGPSLPFRQVVWNRFGPRSTRRVLPTIHRVLDRTMMLASVHQSQRAVESADICLRPPTEDIDMYRFASWRSVAERGYQHALVPLREWVAGGLELD